MVATVFRRSNQRIPFMNESLVDPETGWSVTRVTRINSRSGVRVVEETVTDPESGKVYRSTRVATYSRPIAAWVQAIKETKEEADSQTISHFPGPLDDR
jgi:hypothetical protein